MICYVSQGFNLRGTRHELGFLLGTGALLGKEHSLDVGQHTALGNGHPGEQFVQFLIIPGEE